MTASDTLRDDLQTAYTRLLVRHRSRRRVLRAAAVSGAGALLLAGSGLGAAALLGWPAPSHVKQELTAVDQGLPADLRLNPDAEHARAVAATEDATLYAATLRDGGSCSEIVTDGDRGRGATCSTGTTAEAITLTAPFDDNAGPDAPVVLGGRVNEPAGTSLEARYADGSTDSVPLGEERYFLFEIPAEHRAAVHAQGLELIARDADGAIVGRAHLPAEWDDPAVPDERVPLFVSTRSDESDFTKVYGLEGHVGAAGATKLELAYGDGTRVAIPLRDDGSYEYAVPPARVDDFMQPRTLSALDAGGRVVASAPVAAVAYWRGRERGTP